jgi:signal transduction histidine kinase
VTNLNICADERYTVRGDRDALLELFVNVMDNAIKYNLPQGKVSVSMDTGIGIAEEDLSRVFDRFYCADKSCTKEEGGIGLGVSICDQIVRLHDGRIEIRSNRGEGTSLSVYLKRAERYAPAEGHLAQRKILRK